MKTAIAALLALGLVSGAASAKTYFQQLNETAPRSDVFADIANTAPRSVFEDLSATAPRSVFDQIRDTAPHSDGLFGGTAVNAP